MKRICVHGLGQKPADWAQTMALMYGAEQPLCPSLPSLLDGGEPTYENLYRAFAEYCGRQGPGLDLCGLSLGGMLALNYATDCPDRVHSLVLIGTQYRSPKRLLQFQNMVFRLMPEGVFEQMGFGKRGILKLCRSMAALDFSDSLNRVACPTLIVCGERDNANKKAACDLAALIPGARLHMVAGAGHEVNADAPGQLAELLRMFCCE